MSPDAELPVLPTVDKRGGRHLAAVPDLPAITGDPELARRVSTIPYAPAEEQEIHRLADLARALPKVVTLHEVYGQPPGDLAYTKIEDWTDEQAARAQAWLNNERAKDWWRGQAAANLEAQP